MFKISKTSQYRSNRRLVQNVSSFIFGDYSLECNDKYSQNFIECNGRRCFRTYTQNQNADRQIFKFFGLSLGVGVGIYLYNIGKKEPVLASSKLFDETLGGQPVKGLPFYTLKDVSQHCTKKERIWVTFKQGVYDITDFVDKHPGSDKIMMAAGGSVEPFWLMYGVHKQPEIIALLETFRIGNLSVEEAKESISNMEDPYSADPARHPALRAASLKPYNAEPPPSLLADSFVTPVDLFYVRNHLPVPDVDPESYRLSIEGIGIKSVDLTLEDIKKFPKYTVTATIQCAGNRRKEMSKVKEVKGLSWDVAAIGNGTFSGARLYDVLSSLGLKEDDPTAQHVQFEGLDTDPANVPYGASIPFVKAMNPKADVLLAYEMNGKPLTRDHGFPIRAIVPGTVGARNVKWLGAIYVTEEESQSHWQQNDYKGFSPSTDWDTVDFKKSPAIQELPVTSAFCEPSNNDTVTVNNGNILVKGYAWSGGGNRIVRVDITPDGGKNWYVADFIQQDSKTFPYHWGWTLWQAEIPVSEKDKEVELWVKAVDSSYNNQPETFNHIWNLRGVLGNAFHRIKVNLKH